MRVLFFSLIVAFSIPFSAHASDGSGLQSSVSVDLVAQAGLNKGSGATDGLTVRGAEVMLYSPADHLFDGMMSFTAHGEGGIPTVALHEAVLSSTKLIPRSRFRVGQFFLGVGRLNQFHQHDWPFITAPKIHRTVFHANEGALDTGGEYTYLLPLPFFLEITGGLTNGFIFGHDHGAGTRPLMPTHYLRGATYAGLPGDGGAQIGLNYIGRTDDAGKKLTLLGVDLTAKWKEATVTQMLFQSEFWYQYETERGKESERKFGFYLYPQYYLGANFFAGLRFDYFTFANQKDGFGAPYKNFEVNFVPTFTYRSSEFAQFRLAYNATLNYADTGYGPTNHVVELQSVFILGAHPAHDF